MNDLTTYDDDVAIDEDWIDRRALAKRDGQLAPTPGALAAMHRSEIQMQIDAAQMYPRIMTDFLRESVSVACRNRWTAEACIFAVPRAGKTITGPSVRLAEIMASAYRNLHVGGRIVDVEEKHVIAEGVSWDLEKNVRYTVQVQRKITDRSGKRYSDDMISTTAQAAISIALRNAIFRAIPRAHVDEVYRRCQDVATGGAKGIAERVAEVVKRLSATGIGVDRILGRVGAKSEADVGQEELATLIGLGTAIKSGDVEPDEAFPPMTVDALVEVDAKRGGRMALKKGKPKTAKEPEDDVAALLRDVAEAETADDVEAIASDPVIDSLDEKDRARLLAALDERATALGVQR